MNKLKTVVIIIACLASVGFGTEQALGLQADMVSQGYSYRLLSNSGWGAEIVFNGWYDSKASTYGAGGELRLLKRFNTLDRVKLYIGLGGGYWQFENYYTTWWWEDSLYFEEKHLYDQKGISYVGLVGVDLILFEIGEKSGFTVSPEFQLGYYTWPNEVEDIEREADTLKFKPRELITPGAGIGFKYFF